MPWAPAHDLAGLRIDQPSVLVVRLVLKRRSDERQIGLADQSDCADRDEVFEPCEVVGVAGVDGGVVGMGGCGDE